MNSSVHFSSASNEWETPQALFDLLNAEFHFTLDVCATVENTKCERFFTQEDDGLAQDWDGHVCWMNPPYGREIWYWVQKAYCSKAKRVVCLLPARTDTAWWQDIVRGAGTVRFLRGRLKFGGAKHGAPFPSAIVIFDSLPNTRIWHGEQTVKYWDWKGDAKRQGVLKL